MPLPNTLEITISEIPENGNLQFGLNPEQILRDPSKISYNCPRYYELTSKNQVVWSDNVVLRCQYIVMLMLYFHNYFHVLMPYDLAGLLTSPWTLLDVTSSIWCGSLLSICTVILCKSNQHCAWLEYLEVVFTQNFDVRMFDIYVCSKKAAMFWESEICIGQQSRNIHVKTVECMCQAKTYLQNKYYRTTVGSHLHIQNAQIRSLILPSNAAYT